MISPRIALLVVAVGAVGLLLPGLRARRLLVWNMSASVPTGLYAIDHGGALRVGERIVIDPPPAVARVMAARGYLPLGVPLLKRVSALGGQRVCRFADGVTIDGERAAIARDRDALGRPLPAWSGCMTLRRGQIFALGVAADSFDSRYFGPVDMRVVVGRAVPVWTDEASNGLHAWFAGQADRNSLSITSGDRK